MLPPFNSEGVLPPSDYSISLQDLLVSPLVLGYPYGSKTWDQVWRSVLVENLAILVCQLRPVGITEIFIDGSFVEEKDYPNDIDGYFHCDLRALATGRLEAELNLLDPFKVWTWNPRSRTPCPGSAKAQLPMWHQYRVELYPHYGQQCGIRDKHGHELEFPSAFRQSRVNSTPKGILKIV